MPSITEEGLGRKADEHKHKENERGVDCSHILEDRSIWTHSH